MSKQSVITILHTNDLHSHLENWPKIRRYLTSQKQALTSKHNGVLTIDIGDAIDRIHPLTEATAGQGNVQLLNQIRYDAVTIGNNEGLSLSHDELDHLYDLANFPVTVANFYDLKTAKLSAWNKDVIYKTMPDGTKVAMIGLTVPFNDVYPLRGWQVLAVKSLLTTLIPTVKANADVIVLLSHLGISTDRQLAAEFKELDVIVGAHTHHLLEHGEVVNNTLIAAAGKWGRNIGKISLIIKNHQVVNKVARVVNTAELADTVLDVDEIQGYLDLGNHKLQLQPVALLPKSLLRADGTLMQAMFKMLQKKTGNQVGLLSTGLLMQDLQAGKVTKADLLSLLPHQMYLMETNISGYNLKTLLLEINKNKNFVKGFSMIGLGFRGKYFGDVVLNNIVFDAQQKNFFYNNYLIEDDKIYQLTSLDYYKYLPFFPALDIFGENKILMNKILREDFANYLAETYPFK